MTPVKTLFLDAGGVLVFPNWARVSATLGRHGITVSAEALSKAEPSVRFEIDQAIPHGTSTDTQRAWLYMDRVLEIAGVVLGDASAAAVRELRAYHAEHNLWELVPDDVGPALERLSSSGLKLVVVSNANGVLHRMFDRVGLTRYFTASATPSSTGSRSRTRDSSESPSIAPAPTPRRPCTWATCITSMSRARGPPVFRRC